MIKLFRAVNPLNLFLLVLMAAFLRLGFVLNKPAQLSFEFAEAYTRLLMEVPISESLTVEANIFLAMVISIVQAFMFNRLVNYHNLLGKSSYLPGLMYLTCSALLAPFLMMSPALICNFLVLLMLHKFLNMYRNEDVRGLMFDIGMIIGVGTIIYFPFIGFLPLVWLSLLLFRAFDWREWFTGVIGFATIFFFLATYYFWNDKLSEFWEIWLPLASPFPTDIRFKLYDYLVLLPLMVILAMSFYVLQKSFFRSFVQVRRSFQLLFIMFILAMISFYLKDDWKEYHFLLAVAPASVLIAYYFLHATRRWVYESLYLVLLGFILYFQFI